MLPISHAETPFHSIKQLLSTKSSADSVGAVNQSLPQFDLVVLLAYARKANVVTYQTANHLQHCLQFKARPLAQTRSTLLRKLFYKMVGGLV